MDAGIFWEGIVASALVIVLSVVIGIWGRRLTQNLADYYVAGRSIGAVNNGLAMVSLSLSIATFLGLTALIVKGFYLAISVYTAFTASFVAMLILAAPYLRRHKSFTSMDFLSERFYSKNVRLVSVFVMLIVSILYLIANIVGIGISFEILFGIPMFWGVLIGGLAVTFYVTVGGMFGVTYNQSFQSIVMLFAFMLPVMLVLRALGAAGWFFPPLGYGDLVPGMIAVVPHYFFPFLVHPVWYVAIFLGSFFGIIGLPHFVMRYFTVKEAKEARWSTVICVFLAGLINVSVFAMGFAAVSYMEQQGLTLTDIRPDALVFILVEAFAGQGWLALALAGTVAAGLSTIAGLLMIMGTGLVYDFYATMKPKFDDRKLLKISSWTMLIVGIIVTLLSLRPPAFLLVTVMWAFGIAGAALGVPIVLGIWWKRATKEGALAGMIAGFLTTFVCYVLIEIAGWHPTQIHWTLYGPLGWVKLMAFAIPLSFIITIVVSWLTKEPSLAVKQQVDMMHGWKSYVERRYNSKLLPIIIVVLSVLTILSLGTLRHIFEAIGG
jgi:cation/acetate symporter